MSFVVKCVARYEANYAATGCTARRAASAIWTIRERAKRFDSKHQAKAWIARRVHCVNGTGGYTQADSYTVEEIP